MQQISRLAAKGALIGVLAIGLSGCVVSTRTVSTKTSGGAAASKSTALPAGLSSTASVSRDVEAAINAERARAGLNQLAHSGQLAAAAAAHASDMAANGYFSHTGKDGSSVGQRVKRAGYNSCLTAENIAWGQKSAGEVVASWMQSKGHRENNLRKGITHIGAAKSGGPTWVVVFGKSC
ncbi:MAG: CAP domain-containing protein [Paracoccaceae bacterium]